MKYMFMMVRRVKSSKCLTIHLYYPSGKKISVANDDTERSGQMWGGICDRRVWKT